jgi:hypothetical protein
MLASAADRTGPIFGNLLNGAMPPSRSPVPGAWMYAQIVHCHLSMSQSPPFYIRYIIYYKKSAIVNNNRNFEIIDNHGIILNNSDDSLIKEDSI